MPIWDADKHVSYVIHESVIFEFLAAKADEHTKAIRAAASAQPAQALPPELVLTLKDFLDFESDGLKMCDIVSKIAWVADTASLADAKAKMEGTPDCQDVFVTKNGKKEEPILGWVTNADIAKKGKA